MMNKKLKLCLACAVLLMLVTTTVAGVWIYSNIVTVYVAPAPSYVLTLEPATQNITLYENAVFTANLTKGGSPISGAEITLLFDNGISTGSSNTTTSDGTCLLLWNATVAGTFSFKASYETP